MQITIRIRRRIVADRNVDAFDVDTTTKDVGGHEDALFKVLKLLVALDAFFLRQATVDADRGEVALAQKFVQLVGARDGFDENDNLVELERVEQVVELAVLGRFFQTDVVLLQTVQRQLGLVVDVDFEWLCSDKIKKTSQQMNPVRNCRVPDWMPDWAGLLTFCINFLQVGRTSLASVAENIMTCLW